MKKMDYCAHGYPSYILLSLFDRLWKVWATGNANVQRDMTREEAVELANRCMDEMKNRFPMNEHHYITKIVSKEGIEVMKCCVVCWCYVFGGGLICFHGIDATGMMSLSYA